MAKWLLSWRKSSTRDRLSLFIPPHAKTSILPETKQNGSQSDSAASGETGRRSGLLLRIGRDQWHQTELDHGIRH